MNLDFRVAALRAGTKGRASLLDWSASRTSPAVEVLISADAVSLRCRETIDRIGVVQANDWHNLQLTLDLQSRTYSLAASALRDHATLFAASRFAQEWPGRIDLVMLDRSRAPGRRADAKSRLFPAIEFDNLGIEERPIRDRPRRRSVRRSIRAAALEGCPCRLASGSRRLLANGPFAMAYGMAEGTPHDVRMQMRGEPDQPGDLVTAWFHQGPGGRSARGRLTRQRPAGACALADPKRQPADGASDGQSDLAVPLRPRTREDAERLRSPRRLPPSHPDLLDHLAARFIQSGWSVKAMHRLIILSATFQQASTGDAACRRSCRASARRVTLRAIRPPAIWAEEIRDSILAISGELDSTAGARASVSVALGWGLSPSTRHSARSMTTTSAASI